MKICTSFRQPMTIQSQVQQIRYPIGLFNNVLDRLQNDYKTEFIVEIFDLAKIDLTIERIHDLAVDYSNLFFDFHDFEDFKEVANRYDERKYMYHFPVNTYMDVQYLLQFPGLCAITLEEPLTFDFPNITKTIKDDEERDIQIRIWPHIGRPTRYNDYIGDNGINHFWILPQHLKFYENYVDVIEILDKNEKREHALCGIYLNKVPYLLGLKPLFKNVDSKMIGACIDEAWPERRLSCRQTCLQKGIHCTLCLRENRYYDFALEHPEDFERFMKQPISLLKEPTNPDLITNDDEDIEDVD